MKSNLPSNSKIITGRGSMVNIRKGELTEFFQERYQNSRSSLVQMQQMLMDQPDGAGLEK